MAERSRDALLALFNTGDRLLETSFVDLIDTIFARTSGSQPADRVVDEVPTGALNGENVQFTTAFNFVAATLEVYINGIKQTRNQHFTVTGPNQFELGISLPSTAGLTVSYVKAV